MDDRRAADQHPWAELEAQLGEARRAVDALSRRLEALEQDFAAVQLQLCAEKSARYTAKQRAQEQRRHEHEGHGLQTELKQAQLAFSLKQEALTRLNKKAAALATELGSVKQALHLEREASRNQAKKVEQLQAVEARAAVLETQLADSRTRLAEAGETAARAGIASDELRRQISALEVELSAAKSAIALEERLAKLDKAVFGGEPTSWLNAQSGSE